MKKDNNWLLKQLCKRRIGKLTVNRLLRWDESKTLTENGRMFNCSHNARWFAVNYGLKWKRERPFYHRSNNTERAKRDFEYYEELKNKNSI